MANPKDRMYSESHEWFLVDGETVTIGITKHAADELTDITYVELPAVGAKVEPGAPFGEVESVKATSELFSAVGGEVIEVNNSLEDHPELVNDDPFGEGWLVKIKASSLDTMDELMDSVAYSKAIR